MDVNNTIFILSKGRPWCSTADVLMEIDYSGDWYIFCGDDDPLLEQYIDRWHERVVVFHWDSYLYPTDKMDAYGDSRAGGLCVAKNAVLDFARKCNLNRFWQMDDDIGEFCMVTDDKRGSFVKIEDGMILEEHLKNIASFGDVVGAGIIGMNYSHCDSTSLRNQFKKRDALDYESYQVSNVSTRMQEEWRGRLHEDVNMNLTLVRRGKLSIVTRLLTAKADKGSNVYLQEMASKRADKRIASGGLAEVYKKVGGVLENKMRKFSTVLMTLPDAAGTMVFMGDDCRYSTYYGKCRPKVIREEWERR